MLAIGQPSHAWISGQLARAWGNARFGRVEPYEEVCLAAEQHDIGWASRDLEPLYDPERGRPRSFMEMPLDLHLQIFRDGPRALLAQSRYAALLVSMHGRRLYQRRELDELEPPKAQAILDFLEEQRRFQHELIAELQSDPTTAPAAGEELIKRNSMLVWTWDYLSLALCLAWSPATAKRAPAADGEVDLELTAGDDPTRVRLAPWPFEASSVTIHCEGRRLAERYDSEDELRSAFAEAPLERLELTLSA